MRRYSWVVIDSVNTTALPLPRPSRPRSRITLMASWNERALASFGSDRARSTKSSTRASSAASVARSIGGVAFLRRFFDFVLVLKIPEHVDHCIVGTVVPLAGGADGRRRSPDSPPAPEIDEAMRR